MRSNQGKMDRERRLYGGPYSYGRPQDSDVLLQELQTVRRQHEELLRRTAILEKGNCMAVITAMMRVLIDTPIRCVHNITFESR